MAGRIPQEIIEQILNETDMVELVSRYVRLEKKGGSMFGLCPFHSEKTPSFSVSPLKRIFYCFGCHKGGNAIKFISEIEHISFLQAAHKLAEDAGIAIQENQDEGYKERRELERRLRLVLLEAARFYFRTLSVAEGNDAKAYLKNRGVSEQTQRAFGLGFAPNAWDRFSKQLHKEGVSEQDAIASGMCQRASTGKLIDVFRNRLMIPIFDFLGQIVAFGGRAMGDDKAKYINSMETVLYKKGRHLFAMNLAKKEKQEPFIVTEGYFDAISLHAAGFTSAVALLGTAMSTQQTQLLGQMDRPVTLCLDADDAGINASLRALEMLRHKQIDTRVVLVPEYKDPDLYIQKNGASRFKALLGTAKDEIDFKLSLIEANSVTPAGEFDRMAYQREATDLLAKEKNAVHRELKSERVAQVLKASPAVVQQEIARKRRHDTKGEKTISPLTRPNTAPDITDEAYVLVALSDSPRLWKTSGFELEKADFRKDGFGPYLEEIEKTLQEDRFSYQYLLSYVEAESPKLAEILLSAAVKTDAAQAESVEVLYRRALIALKMKRYEREKDALLQAMENAPEDGVKNTLEGQFLEASNLYNKWRQRRL